MNERIQKLALQSGFGVRQNQIYTSKLEHLPITEDIEKFAQLIVQECASLFQNQFTDERYQRRIDTTIYKHFGVEK